LAQQVRKMRYSSTDRGNDHRIDVAVERCFGDPIG
jgi:hypothetical protein